MLRGRATVLRWVSAVLSTACVYFAGLASRDRDMAKQVSRCVVRGVGTDTAKKRDQPCAAPGKMNRNMMGCRRDVTEGVQ